MKYLVEKDWTTGAGLRAVVTVSLRPDGTKRYRCGYVGVSKSSILAGLHYNDVDIACHRGLTYSTNSSSTGKYPVKSDLYWFGFDCAHLGDISVEPDEFDLLYVERGTVKTLEFCEAQCESIASQLVSMEQRSKKE